MLTLNYFARYREALGVGEEQLACSAEWATIADLRDHLLTRGDAWHVLAEPKVMCARNQDMCKLDTPIADGDEIAFFPPVTGG
ncbi:molybdopterin converting factor subunit 1 [Halopseudomonas salegens]|uniref:Molybdopterin synthase sulfur carrier subunit n=1 Tax=Halopseudomonas salegens TaxID=1434072 RepID=A0A1H2F7T8_9GAMM|nr:molybdopterin converting factor subunit 1 [Halopseudomonas salegens]SDU03421.1 molybdopterin synthase subunit MoaD [Halopseudomonas salegens]